MRSVHRVLKKVKLIEDTRDLAQEFSKQCRIYRGRFDKCVRLGLPSFFTGTGDIYDEDVYLGRIRNIMKDDTALDKVHKPIEAKDINQILKSCFDILSHLKEAFKPKNPPEYARGADLSLTSSLAEEFKYPLGKEWNLLAACLKLHKQNTGALEDPAAHTQGESSSAGRPLIAVKSFIPQEQVDPQPSIPVQHAPGSSSLPLPLI